MADSKVMKLKLLIDKKEKRVLFAEAGKDFVDFIFSILSLPLGTVTSLLAKEPSMIGSLRNLYNSIENLSEQYIQPNKHKSTFLKPKLPVSALPFPLLSLDPPPAGCSSCSNWTYVAGDASTVCPNCRRSVCPNCRSKMSMESNSFAQSPFGSTSALSSTPGLFGSTQTSPTQGLFGYTPASSTPAFFSSKPASSTTAFFSFTPVPAFGSGSTSALSSTPGLFGSTQTSSTQGLFGSTPASSTPAFFSSTPAPAVKVVGKEEGGFVKGVVTYMVMDDLGVTPMSTISSITLINKFNIDDLSVIQEKVVDLGINEALKLLKASLESNTVLTCVFLKA